MFITVDGAKIFTTAFGSPAATCILGIGGWIGNWELWLDPFSILSGAWHTIADDHRGSGATVAPIESITFERLVDDVFAVLDAYGMEHCILAAESAGALTALGAALKNPQRIFGLIIVDGLTFSEPITADDPFLNGLIAHYPQTLDRFVERCVPELDSDYLKRWGRQILDRASQDAAIALYRVSSSIDLRADLPRITQPTLILHGELDAVVRPYAQAIAGEPLYMRFDRKTRRFEFEFCHDASIAAPTEIFVPNYQYPHGYHVKVSDGTFEIDRAEQRLIYRHSDERDTHHFRIGPAEERT